MAAPIKAESPPKVGPLHDIDKWGPKLMDTWAGPLERHGVARARRAGTAVAGAFAPAGGTPALAGGTPALAGGFPAPSGGAGGGDTINVGVLVADEAGLDELERRMSRRRRRTSRNRGLYNDPN